MTSELVRGRFLFREVNERGFDLPLGSVTKDGGVEFRSDLDISVWNPGDDTSGYKRVLPGDFVIGLRSFQSGIGHSSIETIVSPAYTVLRPISDQVHARYFKHLFKSAFYISRLENIAQGIRQGRTIATEDFYNIDCPVLPLSEQQAIADYLDAETIRIDALIAKKQQLIHLLEERWSASLESTLDCGPQVQVRHVTSLRTSGPRGWADRVGDAGSPFVRSANLTQNSIDPRLVELARVEPPSSAEALRSQIRTGDSLVGITGANTGWVAWAGPTVDGGFVSQHVAILRPYQVNSRWLAYSIASPQARDQLLGGQYGGTKTQLGLDELAELKIRVPSLAEQTERVMLLDRRYQLSRRAIAAIGAQVDLLVEHRQALLAAAVTGELDVG